MRPVNPLQLHLFEAGPDAEQTKIPPECRQRLLALISDLLCEAACDKREDEKQTGAMEIEQ